MKYLYTIIVLLVISYSFISMNSFAQQGTPPVKQSKSNISFAQVNKVEGLLVFTDCMPIEGFEVLGKITTVQMGNDYEGTRDALITKVKKKYANADGIIYHFYDKNGVPYVEVIKFNRQ